VAVGVAVSSLETLVSWRDYAAGGVFDGRLLAQRRLLERCVVARVLTRWLFTTPAVGGLAALRLICGITLLVPGIPADMRAVSAAIAFLAGGVLLFRNPFGVEGADQMAEVVLGGVAIGSFFPSSSFVAAASLCFIAAQSCLAYSVSGVAKAVSPIWRSGAALASIMNTRAFGQRWLGSWLMRNRRWSRLLSWTVILAECSFPVAVIAPPWLAAAILVWGALFHVYCALVMGLNTFVWSFVACYPAILYSRGVLHVHAWWPGT
jgi:hypothetical protein